MGCCGERGDVANFWRRPDCEVTHVRNNQYVDGVNVYWLLAKC